MKRKRIRTEREIARQKARRKELHEERLKTPEGRKIIADRKERNRIHSKKYNYKKRKRPDTPVRHYTFHSNKYYKIEKLLEVEEDFTAPAFNVQLIEVRKAIKVRRESRGRLDTNGYNIVDFTLDTFNENDDFSFMKSNYPTRRSPPTKRFDKS